MHPNGPVENSICIHFVEQNKIQRGPRNSQAQSETSLRIVRPQCGQREQIQIEREQQPPNPISLEVIWPESNNGLVFWHHSATAPEESYQAAMLALKERKKKWGKEKEI